ncbi:PACE efflux transporter [Pararhizobium sp. BT-229]|uniref:PACE efflux transporter n=1 Tax=Pararhizobium sp. BT-229 TaxID=2986923 RepID=UPI0021F7C478|nr:PACE efflux transporter [Pararhizobium sp. BT-229]MCV9966925.1 PACE efflux transporter [Pararhizobium sp. BT-229]
MSATCTFPDRLRQAVLFEALGLAIVTPAGTYFFDQSASHMSIVGIFASTLATLWNFVFNLGFDHTMLRLFGQTTKTFATRIVHAALFEIGFLVMLIPPVSWYLDMSLWATFVMDLSIAIFYMVYAFGFNLSYDRIFPGAAKRADDAA